MFFFIINVDAFSKFLQMLDFVFKVITIANSSI